MDTPIVQSSMPAITKKMRQINIVLRQPASANQTESLPESKEEALGTPFQQHAELFKELEGLIGLESVKALIYEIFALLQVSRYRQEAGLLSDSHMFHMIFRGNPGTGKTTVARIVAKLLQSMGVLTKGHLIEAERADLVGEYIGHTALKTRELVKKAMGGVLFVDEAYSLARGGEKDFGKEAIDCLVKAMEDHKTQFVLILAGYSREMADFLDTNPGLPSRFPINIAFPDYSVDELIQIAESIIKEREYILLPNTVMKLKSLLQEEKNRCRYDFSNARFVRNRLEKAIRMQAVRLLKEHGKSPGKQELMTIRPEDLLIKA